MGFGNILALLMMIGFLAGLMLPVDAGSHLGMRHWMALADGTDERYAQAARSASEKRTA
jgi:hypothetical protein